MGVKDITGVLSRFFILGFFLPAFFTLITLSQVLTKAFLPKRYEEVTSDDVLILGGVALLAGLVLLGIRYRMIRFFEGYTLKNLNWKAAQLPCHLLVRWQQVRYDAWKKERSSKDPGVRTQVAIALDTQFPIERERVMPSRFGNTIKAGEDYAYSRWHLDTIAVWPRIDPLLNQQEQELHSNARSDMHFFLNSFVGALLVAVLLAIDAGLHRSLSPLWALYFALPLATAYVLYGFAVSAANDWQVERKASLDLHRLELYERLGVRAPASLAEEEQVGIALSKFLLYGDPIPDQYRRQPS